MTLSELTEPFAYDFFVKGVIVATIAGALCGLVGVFVVLKGMSYIGHGLSHSIFGGFAASTVIGVNFYLGAGFWGLLSALAINGVTRRRGIASDAAIGVVTTASFALGVALLSVYGSKGPSFDNALFGSILGLRTVDVLVISGVFALAVALVVTQYRTLLFVTFDSDVAAVSGISVGRADALLMLVLSLSILSTLTVIGVTLVAATVVIPAVVARMLTNSFPRMLAYSTGIGAISGFVGMNLSYHLNVPSGTTIVLVGASAFVVVFLATGVRGQMRVRGLATT